MPTKELMLVIAYQIPADLGIVAPGRLCPSTWNSVAFRRGLSEVGYIEGRDVRQPSRPGEFHPESLAMEYRWEQGGNTTDCRR
jgi:hypothetical protein